ncbi:uncharacterized protein LAESUDRAFT_412433 [Laetiporus sulphureus 93-53]|uniref:Uncharacterized protein n=1 Tax=Laetiporus sulphureus 93-53 TaxID=1314785 RepID=A0A165C6V8_9APHY|nr:uncharacterized protein LAESUDRAFT_412433 [Laetiporus sulphureus 93-53]KZT02303.1 hypothetical protein LAESUDRAFT_412433 [Laetiporus sulphureus 93-53]
MLVRLLQGDLSARPRTSRASAPATSAMDSWPSRSLRSFSHPSSRSCPATYQPREVLRSHTLRQTRASVTFARFGSFGPFRDTHLLDGRQKCSLLLLPSSRTLRPARREPQGQGGPRLAALQRGIFKYTMHDARSIQGYPRRETYRESTSDERVHMPAMEGGAFRGPSRRTKRPIQDRRMYATDPWPPFFLRPVL